MPFQWGKLEKNEAKKKQFIQIKNFVFLRLGDDSRHDFVRGNISEQTFVHLLKNEAFHLLYTLNSQITY